jgi:hypothetical protein
MMIGVRLTLFEAAATAEGEGDADATEAAEDAIDVVPTRVDDYQIC